MVRFSVLVLVTGCNAILGQHPSVDGGCVKICGSVCAAADDPAFGCSMTGCEPCAVDHATAACASGACGVGACDPAYLDFDLDPGNGCELATPLAVQPDTLALWLRADQGVETNGDGGVSGWHNQVGDGGVQSVTQGAPSIDVGKWPSLPSARSVAFDGASTFGVDLSAMTSAAGFTAFLAVTRHGVASPTSCVLGSPTYPSGDPKVTCSGTSGDGTPGSAFQLGFWDSKTMNYEVYCNSMFAPVPVNGASAYQANAIDIWFDPKLPLNYLAVNGQQTNDSGQRPHVPFDLSSPSILGGCPGGYRFMGLVGEVVLYRTLLTADERATVDTYMKTKWKTP